MPTSRGTATDVESKESLKGDAKTPSYLLQFLDETEISNVTRARVILNAEIEDSDADVRSAAHFGSCTDSPAQRGGREVARLNSVGR